MAKLTKTETRKQGLIKRNRLDPVARTRDSAIIRQRLFHTLEWEDAHTILTYVSFKSEVDTHKLIQEALEQGKRMVVPIIDQRQKTLALSEIQRLGDLAAGPYHGIYEPSPEWRKAVDPSEVELVLVPGVVFDRRGGRIGMGGGYFDKLLSLMPNARRWGLAFSFQLRAQPLPLAPCDVPMHGIITEEEVVEIAK